MKDFAAGNQISQEKAPPSGAFLYVEGRRFTKNSPAGRVKGTYPAFREPSYPYIAG
ncbi:cardiolipin synthetase, partial [Desmospora sp. 8437]